MRARAFGYLLPTKEFCWKTFCVKMHAYMFFTIIIAKNLKVVTTMFSLLKNLEKEK